MPYINFQKLSINSIGICSNKVVCVDVYIKNPAKVVQPPHLEISGSAPALNTYHIGVGTV